MACMMALLTASRSCSRPAKAIGRPIRTETLPIRPRLPRMYTGKTGTPVRKASTAAPDCGGRSRPVWLRVPSGKMPTARP